MARELPIFTPPGSMAEFAEMKAEALALGFKHVESGPLVRSSYHARDQVPGAELRRLRRQATIDSEGRVVPLAG